MLRRACVVALLLSGASCTPIVPATPCRLSAQCPVGYRCDSLRGYCIEQDGGSNAGDGGSRHDGSGAPDRFSADGGASDAGASDTRRSDAAGRDAAPDASHYPACSGSGGCDAGADCIEQAVCVSGQCRGVPALGCGCSATCGSADCCAVPCEDGVASSSCECPAGAVCAGTCTHEYYCTLQCGPFSECSFAPSYTTGLGFSNTAYCRDGASCLMKCAANNRCYLMCADSASCMLDCSATALTCLVSREAMPPQDCDGLVRCDGGIQVCHRPCP